LVSFFLYKRYYLAKHDLTLKDKMKYNLHSPADTLKKTRVFLYEDAKI